MQFSNDSKVNFPSNIKGLSPWFKGAISIVLTVTLCSSVLGMAGCSGSSSSDIRSVESGDVAATAFGENIYENYITSIIEAVRKANNAEDDASWSEYLKDNNTSAFDLRTQEIDRRVNQIKIDKLAADYNISVTDDEVNAEIDKSKKSHADEDAWRTYLQDVGKTELSNFYETKAMLLESKMKEARIGAPKFEEIDETLRKQYTKMYAQSYNTSKRASWILIEGDADTTDAEKSDPETNNEENLNKAKGIVDEIRNGKSFEDAAKEYSIDDDTKDKGGDMGWDAEFTNVDYNVSQALNSLNVGDVSDPVAFEIIKEEDKTDDQGNPVSVDPERRIAIIKCTDKATFSPDTDNINDFPQGLKEYVEDLIVQIASQDAYDKLATEKQGQSNLVVNDMPQNLSYIVSE